MKDVPYRLIRSLFFIGILYASYSLILLSLPYIHFEPNVEFLKTKQLIYHVTAWRWSFYIHVFTSPIVIITGLLQFSTLLLRNYPLFHRFAGYIYITVLIGVTGPAALIMSLYANGSYPAQVSFTILSTLWILFAFLGFHYAKKHHYEKHIKWVLRSYALTLTAVTLRLYAYWFDLLNVGIDPKETYIILSYISWIPNLIVAEIMIRMGFPQRLLSRAINY